MRSQLTDRDIQIIKDHYEEFGPTYCASLTNLTNRQILYIANTKLKLKRNKTDRSYRITIDRIFNKQDIYSAYCLGLLWTDGCVHKSQIFLTTTDPDFHHFREIMSELGAWGISRPIHNTDKLWKPRYTFQTTNPFLADKLKDLNFNNKEIGFEKIYESILDKYKRYFWIGVIDGDGSFFYKRETGTYRFSLCSSLNQNWDTFCMVLDALNIKYKIERTVRHSGSYSKVHIIGKHEVKKLGDYLYQDFDCNKVGLHRKYLKYRLISSRCERPNG